MNGYIIIFSIILLILFVTMNTRENLDFPFDKLHRYPLVVTEPPYSQPYCMNKLGQPIICKTPCQYTNPACQFDYPVPVQSNTIGSYSPSKFGPGPPMV